MSGLRERMELDGRVVLVTGGAGHLGRAIVDGLAGLGAAPVVLDRDGKAADELAREVADAHDVRTLALETDLADEHETRRVPARVLEVFGRLDVLVHAAARVGSDLCQGWAVPFEAQRFDVWRSALDVNLGAPFVLSQAAAPALRASGRGSIVNVASIHGVVGPDLGLYADTDMGHPAAYAASKGGLVQLTRWLATVLAPHVRVNAVSPGGIRRGQPEPFVRRYEARTPLGRLATEDDVIGAVAFFASDLSAYVTGQNLLVDGGYTAW